MPTASSKILEQAVEQFSSLPGIGRKTALKFVLNILRRKHNEISDFANTIAKLGSDVKECNICHGISDNDVCALCSDKSRDRSTICVVESYRDIMAIESTMQYKGLYHVLGGVISPMEGIAPNDLNIDSLIEKTSNGVVVDGVNIPVKEIIFALSATIEGDTTAFYIYKKINRTNLSVTSLAKGIAIGNALDYTDELTLGRSILKRIAYEG